MKDDFYYEEDLEKQALKEYRNNNEEMIKSEKNKM